MWFRTESNYFREATYSVREAKVVAVGGVESMTNAPKLILKDGEDPVESFMHDGLTDAFHYVPMGVTAENIAENIM